MKNSNKLNTYITEEFLQYIDKFDSEVMTAFTHFSEREMLLSRMTKLTEETGELANEILASIEYQRPEKLKNHSKETLEGEFSDVFVTALLLAKAANIDINKAIEDKIKKLNKRYSTNNQYFQNVNNYKTYTQI
ncbi:TPA: hypothetical protein EYG96_00120 [Candidatus Gracilibacteria bacterium]|nr:hypothetical protein [Candidatus Gracilibacteria bacterium]